MIFVHANITAVHVRCTLTSRSVVSERQCLPPKPQLNGHLVSCSQGFKYRSVCTFTCNEHYQLYGGATYSVVCDLASGGDREVAWNTEAADCISERTGIRLSLDYLFN